MRTFLTASLLIGLSALGVAAECQCPAMTSKEQTEAATYVFNGDVWDVGTDPATKKQVITFLSDDTFKGTPAERIELTDTESGTACALDPHEGEIYLVYARWQWGSNQTSR